MPLFLWNEKYSVNISSIDEQHKKLIDIINEFHDKMKTGIERENIGEVLIKLIDYTKYHFSFEEKLFSDNRYLESSIHKEVHAKFVEQINNIKNDFDNGKDVITFELMDFLKDWLGEHILGTDKKYSEFLNAKGIY